MAENGVIEILRGMQADLSGLRADVSDLRTDVSVLKTDVSVLKIDVSGLKTDVSGLKTDMAGLKHDMVGLKHDMCGLKHDMSGIRPILPASRLTCTVIATRSTFCCRTSVKSARLVNGIERTRVSVGEIEALHHDVNRMQRGLSDLTARVEVIERR
jgi:hypothetical protein